MIKKRIYHYRGKDGKPMTQEVTYKLYYNANNELSCIVNEYGYTCEKNSEVFDYFTKNQ